MSSIINRGFDISVIVDYKSKIEASGNSFVIDEADDLSDEFAHFYFVGFHEGKEVVYDAVMYTLRFQHESELYEIAEHRAAQHFPDYETISYNEDENGNLEPLNDRQEEIGLFMAEVIQELEEEEQIKVKEHVDIDLTVDFGIALEIGLHREEITVTIINQFILDYNADALNLDNSLYSFQTRTEETS